MRVLTDTETDVVAAGSDPIGDLLGVLLELPELISLDESTTSRNNIARVNSGVQNSGQISEITGPGSVSQVM